MRLTDNQLEATTKKTLLENEQMASELAFQVTLPEHPEPVFRIGLERAKIWVYTG